MAPSAYTSESVISSKMTTFHNNNFKSPHVSFSSCEQFGSCTDKAGKNRDTPLYFNLIKMPVIQSSQSLNVNSIRRNLTRINFAFVNPFAELKPIVPTCFSLHLPKHAIPVVVRSRITCTFIFLSSLILQPLAKFMTPTRAYFLSTTYVFPAAETNLPRKRNL